ncbi:MAG: hypothetical protein ACOYIF_06290 [Acetivibrionales bacterium]|jgi:hypothetical protein
MKTVGMSWEDCADYWKKDVYTKNVKPLFDAFREAEKAIALVNITYGYFGSVVGFGDVTLYWGAE